MHGWFQALAPKEDDVFRRCDARAATLTRGADRCEAVATRISGVLVERL